MTWTLSSAVVSILHASVEETSTRAEYTRVGLVTLYNLPKSVKHL